MTAPEGWSVKEEAKRLGISPRHLADQMKKHAPPVLRAGRRVLFDEVAHHVLAVATGRHGPDGWTPPVKVPKTKKPRNWNSSRAARAAAAANIQIDTKEEILSLAQPIPVTGTGIYFLIRENKIVYIGQAVNVVQRILSHTGKKEFDAWAWIACSLADLDATERAYINALLPDLNSDHLTARLRRERQNG